MRRLGCLLALTLLSACSMTPPAGPEPQPSTPSPQQTRFQTAPPLSTAPSGTPTELPSQKLAAIESDLRGRGVTATPTTVVSAEKVRFNDGSLGCPQPGVQYTQAQIDGMRVIVEAGGKRYDYRFGQGDVPRLCERAVPGALRSSTR